MNKGKILLIGLAGMLAVACATDTVDQPQATPEASVAKKFVNTSSDAVQGKLLFYVDKGSVAQLEAASTTTTGISQIDAAAAEIGATSIKQVFNMKVNADLKRELGMDRWFSIEFSEDADLDAAAKVLASVDKVQRVEFSTIVRAPKVDAPEVVELANVGTTRAGEFPNDPYFGKQWSLLNEGNRNVAEGKEPTYADYTGEGFVSPYVKKGADINVVPAWDLVASKGSTDIIVAVVDNGVDFNHEDLKDNMLVNEKELNGVEGVDDDDNGYVDDVYGYNFYTNSPVITFGSGHGTHVAGILGAVSNNGKGIAGVAGGNGNGGVRILCCQMLADEGEAFNEAGYDSAAKAMEYAADRGAVISNNSWGNDPGILLNDNSYKVNMSLRYDAFNYFMKKKNHPALDGGIIIFAAGNEGASMAGYPGAYNEYISVTSTGPDGLPAYYTNYGPGCNIAAPGGEFFVNQFGHAMRSGCILSTLPDNKYGYMQGTSMATPQVSGIAALMLSYASEIGKSYSLDQFNTMLLTSVNNIDRYLYDGQKKMTLSGEMSLAPYEGKMGTGSIDTYRALMAVRGISCVPLVAGEECVINLKSLMADGNTLPKTLEEIIVPDDVRKRLGLKNETIFGEELIITCENPGGGVIKIVMVAGGDSVGGGNTMGGMRIEKEIALVVNSNYTATDGVVNNPGGWL